MSAEKVIYLPFQDSARKSCQEDGQFDLFSSRAGDLATVTFLGLEGFDQDDFLKLLVRNDIQLLIDLRRRPVFQKPNFSHKDVLVYLHQRSIYYIDIARFSSSLHSQEFKFDRAFRDKFIGFYKSGVRRTLCTYDESAEDFQIALDFRRLLFRMKGRIVERNPRSLLL